MKKSRSWPLAAFLVLAGPLAAQQYPGTPLVPGARARLTVPAGGIVREEVTIRAVSADSLYVQRTWAGQPLDASVARDAIQRIEIAEQRKTHAGVGAAIGSVAGAFVGGALANAAWTPCTETGWFACFMHPDRATATGLGALGGAAVGALVGVVVGAGIGSTRWVDVTPSHLRSAVVPLRGGRVGLGTTVAF